MWHSSFLPPMRHMRRVASSVLRMAFQLSKLAAICAAASLNAASCAIGQALREALLGAMQSLSDLRVQTDGLFRGHQALQAGVAGDALALNQAVLFHLLQAYP